MSKAFGVNGLKPMPVRKASKDVKFDAGNEGSGKSNWRGVDALIPEKEQPGASKRMGGSNPSNSKVRPAF